MLSTDKPSAAHSYMVLDLKYDIAFAQRGSQKRRDALWTLRQFNEPQYIAIQQYDYKWRKAFYQIGQRFRQLSDAAQGAAEALRGMFAAGRDHFHAFEIQDTSSQGQLQGTAETRNEDVSEVYSDRDPKG